LCKARQGVVFSLDALSAVAILAIFAMTLAFFSSSSSGGSMDNLLSKKQSADLLSAMDKAGVFSTMDAGAINSTIVLAISPGTGYNLNVSYYEFYPSYSGSGGALFPASEFTFSKGNITNAHQMASSQRNFVVPRGSGQQFFGVATLTMWAGG
jgi:hypothetical protein